MLASRLPVLATPPLLLSALDEAIDAIARGDELLVTGGEAGAHVTRAVFAESSARDDGDLFLFEETDREFLLGATGRRDVGKRVETSARRVTLEPDLVEATYDEVAATVVLLAHFQHAVPTTLECFECRFLRDDRRTEHR